MHQNEGFLDHFIWKLHHGRRTFLNYGPQLWIKWLWSIFPCENFTMVLEETQNNSVSKIHRFSPAKRFSSQDVECCNTFYGLSTMLSDTSTTMKAGSCNEKACIQTVSQTSYLCVWLIHHTNMSLCLPIKNKYDKFFAPRREAQGNGLVGPP